MSPTQQGSERSCRRACPNEKADRFRSSGQTPSQCECLCEGSGEDQANREMYGNRVESTESRHGPLERRRSAPFTPMGVPGRRRGQHVSVIKLIDMKSFFAIMHMTRPIHLHRSRFGRGSHAWLSIS
ncbi:MAG: hypothetical protein ACJA0Y_000537 [Maricaulis maris]|jgi:hypothetical protein